MKKKKEAEKKDLTLDLDDVVGGADYFYTRYDIGGSGHSITIKAKDKEAFLDAWALEWRKRAEATLEEIVEELEDEED